GTQRRPGDRGELVPSDEDQKRPRSLSRGLLVVAQLNRSTDHLGRCVGRPFPNTRIGQDRNSPKRCP
ncbi:hypothetical protein, partial [Hydrogenophaga sp.]|uniref:hypothetical protein n=1 Tax=Hydrogenophaga sp. TaxID=1904254 RepID=UPI002730CE47